MIKIFFQDTAHSFKHDLGSTLLWSSILREGCCCWWAWND